MGDTPDATRTALPIPAGAGAISAHDRVIGDICEWFTQGADTAWLIEDLRERKAYGLAKYGTPLHTGDGRPPLRDIYDEVLDKLAYMANALAKDESLEFFLRREYHHEIRFAIRLRGLMAARGETVRDEPARVAE
jgi:hypothetical protein